MVDGIDEKHDLIAGYFETKKQIDEEAAKIKSLERDLKQKERDLAKLKVVMKDFEEAENKISNPVIETVDKSIEILSNKIEKFKSERKL